MTKPKDINELVDGGNEFLNRLYEMNPTITPIWVITERAEANTITTLLLPEEY